MHLLIIVLLLSAFQEGQCTKSIPVTARIFRSNQTVNEGDSFLITCQIRGSDVEQIEWYHIDNGIHRLTKNGDVFASNRYQVDKPSFPIKMESVNYTLTVSNAQIEDIGVFGCKASAGAQSKTAFAIISFRNTPHKSNVQHNEEIVTRPSTNNQCCHRMNISENCMYPLCQSPTISSFSIANLSSCLTHVSSGLFCLSAGHNNLPCCVRKNVSEDCLQLCGLKGLPNAELTLTCAPDWIKLATCFSDSNRLSIDPPFAVKARALNSSSVLVSWLISREEYDTVRFIVYLAEVKSSYDISHNQYKRLESTAETYFVVNGLRPLTRYAFYVVTLSQLGVVSDHSVIVEAITSATVAHLSLKSEKVEIELCCQNRKIDDDCASMFCTLNHTVQTLQSVIKKGLKCRSDVPKILSCLSGRYNHTDCCILRHVPSKCLSFCVGHLNDSEPVKRTTSSDDDVLCLPYINLMASCFAENRGKLPSPPTSLQATFKLRRQGDFSSKTEISFQWKKPSHNNSTSIKYYRLIVTQVNLSSGNISEVREIRTPSNVTQYQLSRLSRDGMYSIRVAAANDYGYSLDVAVSLICPSKPYVKSQQLSVDQSLLACCKNKMPSNCLQFCTAESLSNSAHNYYNYYRGSCRNEYREAYLTCATLGKEIFGCCSDVGYDCRRRFCNKQPYSVPVKDLLSCYDNSDFSRILKCVLKSWTFSSLEHDNSRPLPPQEIFLSDKGTGKSFTVNWKPPKGPVPFVSYIIGYKAGLQSYPEEVKVPSYINSTKIGKVVDSSKYWVWMFTETAKGVRSDPSTAHSLVVEGSNYLSRNSTIYDLPTCCSKVSDNCRPLCMRFSRYHNDTSELNSRCLSDIASISRCTFIAAETIASSLNQTISVSPCCRKHRIDFSCCSIPASTDDLVVKNDCNNLTVLAAVRNCVWSSIKSLGPIPVRNLDAYNISTTHATLKWRAPEYNQEQIRNYSIVCDAKESTNFSNLAKPRHIEILIPGNLTQYEVGNTELLTPDSTFTCSVRANFLNATTAEVLFHTSSERLDDIKLTLKNKDSLTVGSSAKLSCNTAGVVYANISWWYSLFSVSSHIDLRLNSSNNATLYTLANLQDYHSGIYKCEVFSLFQERPIAASVALKVRAKPEALKTDDVASPCGFKGFPDSITWTEKIAYRNGTDFWKKLGLNGQFYVDDLTTYPYYPLRARPLFNDRVLEIVRRATASNKFGKAHCDVSLPNPNTTRKAKPGWTLVDDLCILIDPDECCMLDETKCPNLCLYAKSCADEVPIDCLAHLRQCSRKAAHLKVPSLDNYFKLNTTDLSFGEMTLTNVAFEWVSDKRPPYPTSIHFLVEYFSIYDPHGPYLAPVELKSIFLHVPAVEYELHFFANNQIGQMSSKNVTKKLNSSNLLKDVITLIPVRKPSTSENVNSLIHVSWRAEIDQGQIRPDKAFLYYAPFERLDSGVTVTSGFKLHIFNYYDQTAFFIDDWPQDDVVVLVCIGNSKHDCAFSEPHFLSIRNLTLKATGNEDSPFSFPSVVTICILITVIVSIVLVTGLILRRILTRRFSNREGSPLVAYQPAPPAESESVAMTMDSMSENEDL